MNDENFTNITTPMLFCCERCTPTKATFDPTDLSTITAIIKQSGYVEGPDDPRSTLILRCKSDKPFVGLKKGEWYDLQLSFWRNFIFGPPKPVDSLIFRATAVTSVSVDFSSYRTQTPKPINF